MVNSTVVGSVKFTIAGQINKITDLGFTAAYCTYTVQDLKTQAIVGIYVAHKNQVFCSSYLYNLLKKYLKVKSSSEMEPFSAKTVLLNLAEEHDLKTTSLTTDRSSSVKTAVRLVNI